MKKQQKTVEGKTLTCSKEFDVRFSEVDSMCIVWHGSYALYFEDAREMFGRQYGLGYLDIYGAGYYAPLVDLTFDFRRPLTYGERARIDITYRNTDSAKIIFDYEIYSLRDGKLAARGHSTQVFLDLQYQLALYTPEFFEQWKHKNGLE